MFQIFCPPDPAVTSCLPSRLTATAEMLPPWANCPTTRSLERSTSRTSPVASATNRRLAGTIGADMSEIGSLTTPIVSTGPAGSASAAGSDCGSFQMPMPCSPCRAAASRSVPGMAAHVTSLLSINLPTRVPLGIWWTSTPPSESTLASRLSLAKNPTSVTAAWWPASVTSGLARSVAPSSSSTSWPSFRPIATRPSLLRAMAVAPAPAVTTASRVGS